MSLSRGGNEKLGTVDSMAARIPDLEFLEIARRELAVRSEGDVAGEDRPGEGLRTWERRSAPPRVARRAFEAAERRASRLLHVAFRRSEEALELWMEGRVPAAVTRLHALAAFHRRTGRPEARRRTLEKALEVAREAPATVPRLRSVLLLAELERELGLFPGARRRFGEAAELAAAVGDDRAALRARLGLGRVNAASGRLREAERELAMGPDHPALERDDPLRASFCEALAAAAARRGRREAAEEWSGRAVEAARRNGDAGRLARARRREGAARLLAGDPEGAERSLRAALSGEPPPAVRAAAHLGLGWVALRRGRLLEADEEARRAERIGLLPPRDRAVAAAYRLLGEVARRRGEASGIVFYESALGLTEDRYPFAAALTLHRYGRFRETFGELDRARVCHGRAAEIFAELEAESWLRRATRRLRALRDG